MLHDRSADIEFPFLRTRIAWPAFTHQPTRETLYKETRGRKCLRYRSGSASQSNRSGLLTVREWEKYDKATQAHCVMNNRSGYSSDLSSNKIYSATQYSGCPFTDGGRAVLLREYSTKDEAFGRTVAVAHARNRHAHWTTQRQNHALHTVPTNAEEYYPVCLPGMSGS